MDGRIFFNCHLSSEGDKSDLKLLLNSNILVRVDDRSLAVVVNPDSSAVLVSDSTG